MDLLGPLIGLFSGFGGGGGGGYQSPEAEAIASEIIPEEKKALQERNKMISQYFDPAMTQRVLPALMSRAASTPFYASRALQESRDLERPMQLNY